MAEDLLLDLKSSSSSGSSSSSSSSSSGGPYELHLLCVLKGAGRFYHSLFDSLRRRAQASKMPVQIKMDYIKVKSYSGMQSTGTVDVSGCNLDELKDHNVVIIEDIIDTVRAGSRCSLLPFLPQSKGTCGREWMQSRRAERPKCGDD